MAHEKRILAAATGASTVMAALASIGASSDHWLARATGAAAITLLLASISTSPIASHVPAAWSVALRSARRRLGIAAACVASVHALLAASAYLVPITLAPFGALAWLRHGAIALAILIVLGITSFPAVARALRIRAWSSLHRLAYVAVIFASLHLLAVPFAGVRWGLLALGVAALSLGARLIPRSRVRASPDE